MTDKEKLDTIRTEIHRLVDIRGYDREMANDLFTFMDSLSNEPVSEELEKVAYTYALKCHPLKTFYGETSPNPEVKDAVIYGVKWQKQQMMKDAIDGEIFDIFYPDGDCLEIHAKIPEDKFQDGDKVKLIIIKKE